MDSNDTKCPSALERFYRSNAYLAVCVLVSALGVAFNFELISACVLILLMSGQFCVLRETGRMFYPVSLLIVTLMNVDGDAMAYGAWLVIGAVPAFGSMIYNIIRHKKRPRYNGIFLPMLAVSAAITLGGLFSISYEEYFDIGNLFYVLFLGFLMLLLCQFLYLLWDGESAESLKGEFICAMCHSGIFLGCVMLMYYVLNLTEFTRTQQIVEFLAHNPFRNVAVSYYILTMPFIFYRARENMIYMLGGVLVYVACLISGSRMGLLFGSAQFFICMVYFIATAKKRKWLYAGVLATLVAGVLIMKEEILYFYLGRTEFGDGFISMGESRIEMMRRSLIDFRNAPIFGQGLGYTGNEDCYAPRLFEMHWYHNFICQIAGSLGIAGIIAYMYQLYYRLELLLKRPNYFGWLVCLMYVGVMMTGIVDTGIFTPFPTVLFLNCAFMIIAKDKKEKETASAAAA